MKYHIVEDGDLLLIKISGKARKNEALLAKRLLPHFTTSNTRHLEIGVIDLLTSVNFDCIERIWPISSAI